MEIMDQLKDNMKHELDVDALVKSLDNEDNAGLLDLDLSKINEPWFPDEELIYKWLCHLSYCQFSIDEIKDGTAWNILNNDI